jgi:hypothetical protein
MRLLPPDRTLRVIGFDDAPFAHTPRARVSLCGVVCAGTRFEGMVWGKLVRDGRGATDEVCRLLIGGKFLPQLHLVLLDGLAFGGFNVIDLPLLSSRLGLPCIAVMRRMPRLDAMKGALGELPRARERLALLEKAGPIHQKAPFVFQVQGATPEEAAAALARLTDRGHVPEALRLAHLIGSAVKQGVSGKRA